MLKYIYKHLNIQMHLPVYMCLFSSHILIFMVTLAGIFSEAYWL